MGFTRETFTDTYHDAIDVFADEGRVYLEAQTTDSTDFSFTPKRARKVALAILAAADEAEGEGEGSDVFTAYGSLTKKDAKRLAFALLRGAR